MRHGRLHWLPRSAIVVVVAALVADYASLPCVWLQNWLAWRLGPQTAADVTAITWGAAVTMAALVLDGLLRGANRPEGVDVPRCRHCGYITVGLSKPTCPECGNKVDDA